MISVPLFCKYKWNTGAVTARMRYPVPVGAGPLPAVVVRVTVVVVVREAVERVVVVGTLGRVVVGWGLLPGIHWEYPVTRKIQH